MAHATLPLNGVDTEGLGNAREQIRENPKAGIASYDVNVAWRHGVSAIATAQPMQIGDTKIERKFSWNIDEPPELLGNSSGPTPQEYLMSGVGACIMVGFIVNAAVKGIEVRALDVRMKGSLDLAGFLNLRPDAQVKMSGLQYEIIVDSAASLSELEAIAEVAYKFSPNAMTVHHGVPVTGRIKKA